MVSFTIFLIALNIKLTKLMKEIIWHGICSVREQNLTLKVLSSLEETLPPSTYNILWKMSNFFYT